MENQQLTPTTTPVAVSPEAQSARWVAPIESMTAYSIAEFTQVDSFPGDDGLGVFTQS